MRVELQAVSREASLAPGPRPHPLGKTPSKDRKPWTGERTLNALQQVCLCPHPRCCSYHYDTWYGVAFAAGMRLSHKRFISLSVDEMSLMSLALAGGGNDGIFPFGIPLPVLAGLDCAQALRRLMEPRVGCMGPDPRGSSGCRPPGLMPGLGEGGVVYPRSHPSWAFTDPRPWHKSINHLQPQVPHP